MAGVKLTKGAATRMAAGTKKIEQLTTSGAIRWLHQRVHRGGGGGEDEYGIGMLIADVPACTIDYLAADPWSSITPGTSDDAVIPIVRDEIEFKAELNDDEDAQVVLNAINPVWPTIIKASTTLPVIVNGYRATIGEGESEERSWIITNVIYPVTIITGRTTSAVTGGSFDADHLVLLWGRDPGIVDATTEITDIANPDGWNSDDNAYCLLLQLTDGTWQAIDLACVEA